MTRKVEIMPVDQAAIAQENFSSHVQSIAFNLTLSRRMIECLRVVRDYGFPHLSDSKATPAQIEAKNKNRQVVHRPLPRGDRGYSDNFVGFMRALDHRGLIVFATTGRNWDQLKHNEPTVRLSKAGELVCALLVEAGLMPAKVESKLCLR
jgi:hypothetical protein